MVYLRTQRPSVLLLQLLVEVPVHNGQELVVILPLALVSFLVFVYLGLEDAGFREPVKEDLRHHVTRCLVWESGYTIIPVIAECLELVIPKPFQLGKVDDIIDYSHVPVGTEELIKHVEYLSARQ